MTDLGELLEKNRHWAATKLEQDNDFFNKLAAGQSPKYLWIGCSDSRVPATEILGLEPGDVFVHRNIANQVVHSDLNCLSVIEYAVNVLKVEHVIVCGHYGCGGVCAAMGQQKVGMINNWIRHIKDIYYRNHEIVDGIENLQDRQNKMCELNVSEQVHNLAKTAIIQDAWARGQELTVHGWIYSLSDGLLKDLQLSYSKQQDLHPIYQMTSQIEI